MRGNKAVYCVLVLFLVGVAGAAAFDVSIQAPQLEFKGPLADQGVDSDILNEELEELADFFERQLQGEIDGAEDIARFSNPKLLARGFANAGATASHLATQRSFNDYSLFAFVIGTGVGAAAPSLGDIDTLVDDVEEDGDLYVGLAIQPISASLGINLSRFVEGLRVNAKLGFFNAEVDEVTFESLSIALGGTYELLESRGIALGILRWRGLWVASGFNFQRNTTTLTLDLDTLEADSGIQFGDILDPTELAAYNFEHGTDVEAEDPFGTLALTPSLEASIESRTFAIPLEVNTGIRLLYILELNAGAGVDLVFGSSELKIGAATDVDFIPDPAADGLIDVTQEGRGSISIKTTNNPQLLRPRVTAGVGLNMGPVKLDVPLMYYFDTDGQGAMLGINLGIVW